MQNLKEECKILYSAIKNSSRNLNDEFKFKQ